MLSTFQIANMKYEGLLESHSMRDLPGERISEEAKRQVLGENACRLLRLG